MSSIGVTTPVSAAAEELPPLPVTRLEPSKGWLGFGVAELWTYRELLYFLTWRDVKVRYKQTALGAAWAVLQPLFMLLVFTLFFKKALSVPGSVPYSVLTFAALVPWTFFANALSQSSNSVVGSANLVRKVYFPRLAIPFASVAAGLVDLAITFVLLIVFMLFHGIMPGLHILYVPLFVLLAIVASLGVGLWLAALNVQYRDIKYVIPFMTQFWMFASPVAYPSSRILQDYGDFWYTLYGLNPMAGVVEGFQWALLGVGNPPGPMVLVSALTSTLLLVGGLVYFRRMEREFADLI